MALNDVYQVVVNHVLAGKETTNAIFYRESKEQLGPPLITAGDLAREFFHNVWVLDWKELLSNECRLSAIWGQRIWPTLDAANYLPFTGETGLVVGESCPNGTAVLLSGKGQDPAQNFWRRLYIAGLPEANQQGSQVISAARAAWTALADTLRDDVLKPPSLFPGEYTPCSFSRELADPVAGQPTSDLKSLDVNWAIKSQRRRNLKRGTA